MACYQKRNANKAKKKLGLEGDYHQVNLMMLPVSDK